MGKAAVAFLTYREGVDAFRFTDRCPKTEGDCTR
jgi:hypothetical protein